MPLSCLKIPLLSSISSSTDLPAESRIERELEANRASKRMAAISVRLLILRNHFTGDVWSIKTFGEWLVAQRYGFCQWLAMDFTDSTTQLLKRSILQLIAAGIKGIPITRASFSSHQDSRAPQAEETPGRRGPPPRASGRACGPVGTGGREILPLSGGWQDSAMKMEGTAGLRHAADP